MFGQQFGLFTLARQLADSGPCRQRVQRVKRQPEPKLKSDTRRYTAVRWHTPVQLHRRPPGEHPRLSSSTSKPSRSKREQAPCRIAPIVSRLSDCSQVFPERHKFTDVVLINGFSGRESLSQSLSCTTGKHCLMFYSSPLCKSLSLWKWNVWFMLYIDTKDPLESTPLDFLISPVDFTQSQRQPILHLGPFETHWFRLDSQSLEEKEEARVSY